MLYCKIQNGFFIFCVCLLYYLCEKYYKPMTVQYYIANCISWVPRLTLLDFQKIGVNQLTLGMKLVFMKRTGASLAIQAVKNLPAMQETWVGKIPWRREWLAIPVFLPGKSHEQRSLVGYSPWGHKESDMTE